MDAHSEIPRCWWFSQTYVLLLKDYGEWWLVIIGGASAYTVHMQPASGDRWKYRNTTAFWPLHKLRCEPIILNVVCTPHGAWRFGCIHGKLLQSISYLLDKMHLCKGWSLCVFTVIIKILFIALILTNQSWATAYHQYQDMCQCQNRGRSVIISICKHVFKRLFVYNWLWIYGDRGIEQPQ